MKIPQTKREPPSADIRYGESVGNELLKPRARPAFGEYVFQARKIRLDFDARCFSTAVYDATFYLARRQ